MRYICRVRYIPRQGMYVNSSQQGCRRTAVFLPERGIIPAFLLFQNRSRGSGEAPA
jgi:hypothetical protein